MTQNPFRYFKTPLEIIQLALTFLKKAMDRCGGPKLVITDRQRSYSAAMKEIGNKDRQEVGRHINHR